jgi:hypothetical protein
MRLLDSQLVSTASVKYVSRHCDGEGVILTKTLNCGLTSDRRNGFCALGFEKGASYDIQKVNSEYFVRQSRAINP